MFKKNFDNSANIQNGTNNFVPLDNEFCNSLTNLVGILKFLTIGEV